MIPAEAVEAAEFAVAKEMRNRTYDRHAYNDEVFIEGVTDIARLALEAAAPYMLAGAWEEGYSTGNAHNGRRDANPHRLNTEEEK